MRHLLPLLLIALSHTATTQSIFLPRQLNCPGSETLDAGTTLADIDNDGDLDLVGKSNSTPNTILVYRNQGDSVDTHPVVVPVPSGLGYANNSSAVDFDTYFLLYDWNQDGLPDLFGRQNEALYWVQNLGGLAFGSAVQIGPDDLLNPFVGNIEVRDFNGDQMPDLAVLTEDRGGVRFIDHAGTELSVVTFFNYPKYTDEVQYLDFDSDGQLDIVVPRRVYPGVADLLLYRNTGGLQFQLADTIASNLYVSNIEIIDLDGVAPAEIVYRRNTNDSLFYSKWEPAGQQFVTHYIGFIQTLNFQQFRANIWSADLNGDGLTDILADNVTFFQQPGGNFLKVQVIPDPQRAANTSLGDTDGDGLQEIWFRSTLTNPLPAVFRVEYTGTNAAQPMEKMWTMYPGNSSFVRVFDADNDGQLDVYFQTSEGPFVLCKNNNEVFTDAPASGIDISLVDVKTEDLDGDGFKDLLFINSTNAQATAHYWSKNLGNGQFQFMGAVTFTGAPIIFPFVHGLSDLDNDGLPDILSFWRSGNLIHWTFFKNTGAGTFAAQDGEDMESYFSFGGVEVNFHDVNGDGFQDIILFYRSVNNQLRVLRNDAGAGFTEIQNQVVGSGAADIWYGLADVTNDGKKDVVYAFAPNNNFVPKVVKYLAADGNGTFSSPAVLSGLPSDYAQDFFLQDVNNDGLDDLISQTSGFQIGLNTGTGFGPLQPQGGGAEIDRLTSMADFDADGDLDWFEMKGKMLLWENLTVSPYRITGLIFFDENGNGVRDPGEPPFHGAKVGVDSLSAYAFSDSSGHFNLPLGSNGGSFEVRSLSDLNPYLTFTTPYPATATISTAHPSDTVLIGVQVQGGLQSRVEQTLGSHRCAALTRHWVSFTSIAPFATKAELTLQLPAGIQVIDIDSLPAVVVQGQEIRWGFDSLPALGVSGAWVDIYMPASGLAGSNLSFVAALRSWAGGDTVLTRDTLNRILLCSFDPNDKQIANLERFMEGDHLYTVTDQVEYTIRFQNTGTDTASQVTIRDILPAEFDPASLQVLAASHDYRAFSDANGSIKFEFPGIRLPDSTVNFTGSMGYIKFAANLKPGAAQATDIRNGARIYFDQNPPVYTNITAFQRVDCSYFTQIKIEYYYLCVNGENAIPLQNFGVSQEYKWFLDGELVSTEDTGRFFIATDWQHLLRLEVTNKLCQVDTVTTLGIPNAVPILGLNIQNDTTTCGPLYLSSTVYCTWTAGGAPVYGPDFVVSATGLNTVFVAASGGGNCIARDTILVNQLDLSTWQAIYHNPGYQYVCPGETLQLSSIFNQNVVWTIDNGGQQLQVFGDNPLQLNGDTLLGEYWVFLNADTLNCSLYDYLQVNFVVGPVILQQATFLATENGQQVAWFYATSLSAPFDSIAYEAVLSNPANGYYFIREITGTCDLYSDTIFVEITDLTEISFGPAGRAWFDFRQTELNVEGELGSDAWFRVYDMTGRCVLENQLRNNQRLESLPNGAYLIRLEHGNQAKTIKAVVQRL